MPVKLGQHWSHRSDMTHIGHSQSRCTQVHWRTPMGGRLAGSRWLQGCPHLISIASSFNPWWVIRRCYVYVGGLVLSDTDSHPVVRVLRRCQWHDDWMQSQALLVLSSRHRLPRKGPNPPCPITACDVRRPPRHPHWNPATQYPRKHIKEGPQEMWCDIKQYTTLFSDRHLE